MKAGQASARWRGRWAFAAEAQPSATAAAIRKVVNRRVIHPPHVRESMPTRALSAPNSPQAPAQDSSKTDAAIGRSLRGRGGGQGIGAFLDGPVEAAGAPA